MFRTYNILEYKSPEDYLSIDDFYKVYGYACFYKSDVKKVDSIKAGDITISFFSKHYPRKMMKHLEEERHLKIKWQEEGIYHISGDIFPMQLIITSELSKEINFWLKNLTNDLKETKEMEDLVHEYSKHQKSKLHQSVMNIIVRANRELFRRDHKMCEALIELMQDVMQDELEEQKNIGILLGENRKLQELIRKKLSKGKSIELIAEELEEERSVIEELMKTL